MLSLYLSILPNSYIKLSSILVEFIGFSMYTIMSSANNDNFTFSFPILITFVYFSCLIAVAGAPNTMLSITDENIHPCLVPYHSGKAFIFCLLSMMLAVGFLCMALKCTF